MKNDTKNVSKMFMIIAVVYVTCLLLSNLIAGKMWAVTDSITLPAAVILFPITYIFADVFTEVYGFKKARIIIWLGRIRDSGKDRKRIKPSWGPRPAWRPRLLSAIFSVNFPIPSCFPN